MNISELISQLTKPTISSMKATQVLYELRHSDDEPAILKSSLQAVSTLCQTLFDLALKHRIHFQDEQFRIYTRPQNQQETEYFCLSPHLSIGYSPFIFFKPEKKTRGIFVRVEQHRFTWCSETMRAKAQALYQKSFKSDAAISLKEAKQTINNNLLAGNLDNIPLVEKVSYTTFYLDLDNHRVLAKSSHRDQDGIATFFKLIAKAAKSLDEQYPSLELNAMADKACSEMFLIDPYTNHAISKGLAYGAYNISKMVEFYSNQSDDAKACTVIPTWSAELASKENDYQKIHFKNSIGLFLDGISDIKAHSPTFTMINQFAGGKNLDVTKLTVVGEVPTGKLITEYMKDYVPDEGEPPMDTIGSYIDLTFNTQAKDGNICIQLHDNLSMHTRALQWRLRTHMKEHHCSSKDVEQLFLKWLGYLLEVVHDSIDLFTTLYIESNPITKEFGEKSGVEVLLDGAE